jgi:Tfp pilus assembly protein PilZ
LATETERRKEPRIEVTWPVAVFAEHGTIEGETRNISIGGLAISCDEPLRLNESYRISISPPNHSAVGISGKVIWSDLYGIEDDDTTVGMGVCFVEISDEDRNYLEEVVTAHLKGE